MNHLLKGIQVNFKLIFPNRGVDILGFLVQICGNGTELGDVSKSPAKSFLLLLTT